MKLSVCMIAGKCSDTIEATLHCVSDIADEIVIVQTVEDAATAGAIRGFESQWDGELCYQVMPELMHEDGYIRSFSAARNESFALATGDWIMWLDSDDTIFQPFKIKEFLNQIHENGYQGKQVGMIQMDYDYEFDGNGRCTTRHSRERIVRNGNFKWIAPIHEVMTPLKKMGFVKLSRTDSYIIHNNVIGEDQGGREERNVLMLKRIVESDECDARMKMYYANSLAATGNIEAASHYYQEYLEESNWDEERYQVMLRLCDLYKTAKHFEQAGAWAAEACRLLPALRDAFLALAEVSALQDDWPAVMEWLEIYGTKAEVDAALLSNPLAHEVKPWLLAQQGWFRAGNFIKSIECSKNLIALLPEKEESLRAHINLCYKQLNDIETLEAFETVLNVTPEEDHGKIYEIIPEDIAKDYPKYAMNRKKDRPNDKRIVAIYCGYDATRAWGPESIKEGIGGSEEAVINISREFASKGWHVEVYANVSKEGVDPDTGVVWYSALAANPNDLVDLCILWRHPQHKHTAPKGNVTWLWNHDLQDGMEPYYDSDTMSGIDSVMFLSKFHRLTAPWVPDSKVFYTTNGVDDNLMLSGSNDINTVVFASSPDRGLDTLLSVWPTVVEARPDARLKVFYGFNAWFDERYKNDKGMMQWKQDLLNQMEEDPTIDYRGSVGQDVLAKEIAGCGVWAYPTQFGEISCITAMKMQCAGAIPVCTKYAALDETVRHGVKVGDYLEPVFDKDEFTTELIDMIGNKAKQNLYRTQMIPWARNQFSWVNVCDQWLERYESDNNKLIKQVKHA